MDEQTLAYLRRIDDLTRSGTVCVIKLDGGRLTPGDPGRYTVVISGGPLDGHFRKDGEVLDDLLAEAIAYYEAACGGTAGRHDAPALPASESQGGQAR